MTKFIAALASASVLLAVPAFAATSPTVVGAVASPSPAAGHTTSAVAHKHHKHHKHTTSPTSAKHKNKAKKGKTAKAPASPAPVVTPKAP